MNKNIITAIVMSCAVYSQAQSYSITELEASFLQNNYLLIASKYDIDKADAEIVQEKLWDNPTLNISEVNLWKTYNVEEQPYLFGKYGRNQQVSVELEQLIETAGKRKKRVAVKNLEKNNALFDYEELMRDLKKDLRQTFNNLARIQQQEIQLNNTIQLFEQLYSQYERQSEKQNIARSDYYRIQTELIALQKEQVELESDKIEELNELKTLTQIPDLTFEQLNFNSENIQLYQSLPLNLFSLAIDQNIEVKRQSNELNLSEKQLELEKAQRTPDLTFGINYDRGGNIMRDFVGIGVSFDIPIFNTNKGNIQAAKISIEQEKTNRTALEWKLQNEIERLQKSLIQYENSLQKWKSQQTDDQKLMLENYQKHLKNKQVTLLEFIDFTQAYREAQGAYLELLENYQNTYEELQYVVGKDF